jgi:ribonuclease R
MKKTTKKAGGATKRPPWMPDSMVLSAPKKKSNKSDKPTSSKPKAGAVKKSTKASASSAPRQEKFDGPRSTKKRAPFASSAKRPSGGRHDPFADREAAKYAQPILSREALMEFLSNAPGPLTGQEIANALKLTAPDRFEALTRRLNAMQRDGQVLVNRRGGYAAAEQLDLIAGSVIAHPDGFGFLKPEKGGDDLFLPPNEMRKCLHGDRVLASVAGVDYRGRREASIVEILEQRLTRIVGRYSERAGIGSVVPDDKRILAELMIPSLDKNGAKDGQMVVCEIIEAPSKGRAPVGKVLVVLGDKLTPSRVVEMAIYGHNLPNEFPQEALNEAAAVPIDVPVEVINQRVDLRKMPLVTIDGEDAKDFDDAVYCENNAQGFRLVVAIADVSHYVRPGTALDDEAINRATSVYFPGFVVPMLPETLSNGICSLKPKVDRMCFVCDMQMDFEGKVLDSKFYEAVMNSHARLTYNQVWKAIGENDNEAQTQIGAALMPKIQKLHQLYDVLAKARVKRGAIEFESSEVRFVLDNTGAVKQAGMLERNDAHKLIEECMIAANVEAAKFIMKKAIPAPFRVHDRPPESKYAELLEYLSEFGLRLPAYSVVQPKDFTNLLKKIRERPDAALLETVLLRSQSLAVYATENKGHFGLALEAYGHFTSPIRRYPDLLLHRSIKHALLKGSEDGFSYSPKEMDALCLACSEKARRADEAEREVDERFRSAWMEQHVGSEFDGVISGVTSFGLFVELKDSKVNGLVHITQLPHDYYHFDPARKALKGERKGLAFRLGDPLRVLVLRASVEERRIDFKLADAPKKKKVWAQ